MNWQTPSISISTSATQVHPADKSTIKISDVLIYNPTNKAAVLLILDGPTIMARIPVQAGNGFTFSPNTRLEVKSVTLQCDKGNMFVTILGEIEK